MNKQDKHLIKISKERYTNEYTKLEVKCSITTEVFGSWF